MWAEDRADELNFLPAPPDSLENGPNIPAPSEDHFWIPGSYVYSNVGYQWRAGYWSPGYDNWMWVPARYVWTPRGCYYVSGYWDYAFARRGVLFAPVYYPRPIYARPAFVYSPSVVVSLGGISSHLFVGVGFGHYYFGDYYGDACFRRGFYPWHVYHRQRCFDPCLNYYAWHHRRHDHVDYVRRLEDRHDHFVKNADLRPPRTYVAQRDWERRVGEARARDVGELGRSLRDVERRPDNDNLKLVKLADTNRREIDEHRSQLRQLSTERSKLEKAAGDARVRGDVARGDGGRTPAGNPRDLGPMGRGPDGRDTAVRRTPGGPGDAARSDAARLKLPKTVGAEQRASVDRNRSNVPSDAVRGGGEGTVRSGDTPRRGTDVPRDPSGRDSTDRGDAGRRGLTQPSDPRPSLPRETQPRETQPRDGQPRVVQPRDTQPRERESQPRVVQPRESQPRVVQPRERESQPRVVQPRESQPRDSQPRSFQPRERESQPRDIQPRGGSGSEREGQPRGGNGRERSGRTSIEDRAAPAVTEKPAAPPTIFKPREGAVAGPRQETKPSTAARSRDSTETRLKLPMEPSDRGNPAVSGRERGGGTSIPRSSRSSEAAPRVSEPAKVPPAISGGRSSSRGESGAGSAAPRLRSSEAESRSSRSSGAFESSRSSESRGRSGSSESKSTGKEKEDESKSPSGRGRGR
jgi:hypothetical protein